MPDNNLALVINPLFGCYLAYRLANKNIYIILTSSVQALLLILVFDVVRGIKPHSRATSVLKPRVGNKGTCKIALQEVSL